MESAEYHYALAVLQWQVELGATEAICDAPVDRYALEARVAPARPSPQADAVITAGVAPKVEIDALAVARSAAGAAGSLDALREAVAAFDLCELKRGARKMVFGAGQPGARVMIVGEAPGREEDRAGQPFVGEAGQLLDRMLAAIGLARSAEVRAPVYITTALPWRPPQDRDPKPEEIAMMRPFLERHIALAAPEIVIAMGNVSCQALLGKRGIARLRGRWAEAFDLPVMPMFHPDYLLRTPSAKRETWTDLLSVQARLRGG